jgi:hypothetical protein
MFARRKDDEDPFAVLRDGVTYQSAPAQPSALGPVLPVGVPGKRRRLGFAGFGNQVVLGLVIGALGVAAVAIALFLVGSVVHSKTSVPSINVVPASGPARHQASPTLAAPVSYLSPAGLRAGLAHVAKLEPGARLTVLRIDANSFSAVAMLPNGAAKEIYFGPTGVLVTAGAATGERPIPVSRIRPLVVGRLVVEIGRRFQIAPDQIEYMVVSSPPGLPTQWLVFSKSPARPEFSATLSGANLAPLGG